MKKLLSFLCWLPFGVGCTWLNQLGWGVIGLPLIPAWSLAIGTSAALGVLAHLAGGVGHWVHYSGLVLVIAFTACVDGLNLEDAVRKTHSGKLGVAKVEAGTASAGLATLSALVTGSDEAIREKRKALALEMSDGGIGPKARAMMAQVDAMEASLAEKRAELAKAEMTAATSQVAAAHTEAEVHVLATYPRWVLYLGALALELVAAAVAFGQGRTVTAARTYVSPEAREVAPPEPRNAGDLVAYRRHFDRESMAIRRALKNLGVEET